MVALIVLLSLVALWFMKDFSFDASAETLVVEGDANLETYRHMTELFGGDDFIVLTYSGEDLFTPVALAELAGLQEQVRALPGVRNVFSILDAPLIESPPIPIREMTDGYHTLRSSDTDPELARKELTTSPLFADFLISTDGRATAIRIDLSESEELESLRERRDRLREIRQPSDAEAEALDRVEQAHYQARMAFVSEREALIDAVQNIKRSYDGEADIYISGVPLIASVMISYVKSDLAVFGSLVLLLIVVLLYFFFRKVRWVLLPFAISVVSNLITMGILGFSGKPVTVISSNFISLLAIICISFSIHLIVRYRELLADEEFDDHFDLVCRTMESKFIPCLYTALTTILAFGSMMVSRIVPVEDFGWMMCLGIWVAFGVTYVLFPAVLLLLGPAPGSATLHDRIQVTMLMNRFCRRYSFQVIAATGIAGLVAAYGLTQLTFDNRFVDYFDEDTDIHQGIVFIDRNLGGTVPFSVYLKFDPFESEALAPQDDFFTAAEDEYPERYWFTPNRIETVAGLHDYLASRGETGKVVSIATLEALGRNFNDGEPLGAVAIAMVLGALPEEVNRQLIHPYARPDAGIMRIQARIRESGPLFSRDQLIADVEEHAAQVLGLPRDRVIVSGMFVLFNDMLRQLADSQLRTLFYVVGATFLMFSLMLRSIPLALVALIPNVVAAALVISVMGYANIPMDMMTITIAAISIGIGVDDAIHYLHRYREEYRECRDVVQAVTEAHKTIGKALYFTSITIMAGFSILAFSNFMPTVFFGVLTTLAMGLALLANLTVLPSLLIAASKLRAR